jgi:hypothetical protein
MSQANPILSRRRFAVSLAGSVASLATAPALNAPLDPVYAAIERHKAAEAALEAAVGTHNDLEAEIPAGLRQSSVYSFEEDIVATDDPRWIASERAVSAASARAEQCAMELVTIRPTTWAGLRAVAIYAVEADTDGEMWPRQVDHEGETATWHHWFIKMIAETLPTLAA